MTVGVARVSPAWRPLLLSMVSFQLLVVGRQLCLLAQRSETATIATRMVMRAVGLPRVLPPQRGE